MKKTTKLIVSTALMLSVLGSVGCGAFSQPADSFVEDQTKTTLKVSNYQGGFGRVWLDEAVKRFEEKYKDTSFEPDKKGVQVKITSSINDTAGDAFLAGLPNNQNHVIFTQATPFSSVVIGKYAADITDIVTQDLTDFGESVSIEDKLDSTIKDFFGIVQDGQIKYYALPHYEEFHNIVYNVDLFDDYGFWLTKDGTYVKDKEKNKAQLAAGPDGKANTYDDGLPATYDEFFALCDYMVSSGVIPFTWAGGIKEIPTSTMAQLWADYEGKDNFMLNYTHSGTATTLVNSMTETSKLNANGVYDDMMPATEITESNAKLLQKQAGKYAALDFMKRIATNPSYYTTEAYAESESNKTAHRTYISSTVAKGKTPVAFLMEGVYWENEADENGVFDDYSKYGISRYDEGEMKGARFGSLPFPKASAAQVGQKRTLVTNCLYSLSFINSNIKDANIMKLAKTFYQFVHTDNELQEFSVNTGTLKPLKYEVPAEKQTKMSYYGREILAIRSNADTDVVYTYANTDSFRNNMSAYELTKLAWSEANPLIDFNQNPNKTIYSYYENLTK